LNFDVFFSRVACAVVAGLPPDFKKDVQEDQKPARNEVEDSAKT
jgi:hypothetical protein